MTTKAPTRSDTIVPPKLLPDEHLRPRYSRQQELWRLAAGLVLLGAVSFPSYPNALAADTGRLDRGLAVPAYQRKETPDKEKPREPTVVPRDGVTAKRADPNDLTSREKRMLRWLMTFKTKDGPDYLNQLKDLGAILAIPVKETPAGDQYRIVRDLARRPAKLLDEDLSKIQRIYWIDEDPGNVAAILAALGHPKLKAKKFVAFMPVELENKLFELEKAYAKKHHPGLTEDEIEVTRFKLRRVKGRLEPYVTELEAKRSAKK